MGGAVAYVISAVLELDKKEFNDGLKESSDKAQQFGKDFQQAADKTKKGLQESTKEAESFGNKFESICNKAKAAFAAIVSVAAIKQVVTGLKGLADETAEYGDNIDKMSQKLGMSAKAYQEWGYIMEKNGSSVDTMSRSMRTINSAIEGYASASDETKQAYAQLGLTMSGLYAMDTDTRLNTIIKAFQKMPDGAKKSALAVKIFGQSATELMPLLNSSEEDVNALREEMERLGIIMSDDEVKAAAHYQDTMTKLNYTLRRVRQNIGEMVMPTIDKWADNLADAVGRLNKAYQEGGLAGVANELRNMAMEIKLPSYTDIVGKVTTLWEEAKPEIAKVLSAVFGLKAPTVESALDVVGQLASDMSNGAANLLKFAINLMGGDVESARENAEAFFDDVLGVGRTVLSILGVSNENLESAKKTATEFIDDIKKIITDINAGLGVDASNIDSALQDATDFMFSIYNAVKDILKFTIGIEMPPQEEVQEKIQDFFTKAGKATYMLMGGTEEQWEKWQTPISQYSDDMMGELFTAYRVAANNGVYNAEAANRILKYATSTNQMGNMSPAQFLDAVKNNLANVGEDGTITITPVLDGQGVDKLKSDINENLKDDVKAEVKPEVSADGKESLKKEVENTVNDVQIYQPFTSEWFGLLADKFKDAVKDAFYVPDLTVDPKLTDDAGEKIQEGIDKGNYTNDTQPVLADGATEKLQEDMDKSRYTNDTQPVLADGAVENLQNQLDSSTYTVNVTPNLAGATDLGAMPGENNASGTWRVPYTGYTRVLGKDEAVLTRIQAQEWRTSQTSGSNGGSVDYGRLAAVVASAVQRAIGSVQATVSGNQIAGFVSDYLTDSVRYGGVAL